MWRKNRGDIGHASCVGVDLNRQFPIGFRTTGGSSNKCASTYAGEEPLEQVETAAWDSWFREIRGYYHRERKIDFRQKNFFFIFFGYYFGVIGSEESENVGLNFQKSDLVFYMDRF